MEGLVKGDVVVIPFPFSTLTGDDHIVAQITSVARNDNYSI